MDFLVKRCKYRALSNREWDFFSDLECDLFLLADLIKMNFIKLCKRRDIKFTKLCNWMPKSLEPDDESTYCLHQPAGFVIIQQGFEGVAHRAA